MSTASTITSQGQVTIPAAIRHFLGVSAKDRVRFEVEGDSVVVRPQKSFLALRGSVKANKKYSDSDADSAVLKLAKKQYEEKLRRSN